MRPIKIRDGIYNVGAVDWNIRDFHGYSTNNGTTYNAYLIIDDKITLIDTVKRPFIDHLMENIAKIVDPKKIDYVISNHTEMDHSGALPILMHQIGIDKPVYCSKMGFKNLSKHFPRDLNYQVVNEGSELSIGKRTLQFIETKMLHWPDSMFTYAREDKILFSSDAFGQHYAGPAMFDDEAGESILLDAKKYFANILLLFSGKVKKLIEKVVESGIEIEMICPDHGIIWRKDPGRIIQSYMDWSDQKAVKKAVIAYDTMWESTNKMALKIADGITEEGVDAVPMHIRNCHRSDIMTEILDAAAVIIGSPTLNNNIYPTVADLMVYIKGLKPIDKIAAAFGSYGWSGEAIKQVNKEFEDMKFEIVDPGLKVQYVPNEEDINNCLALGRKIGQLINRKVG